MLAVVKCPPLLFRHTDCLWSWCQTSPVEVFRGDTAVTVAMASLPNVDKGPPIVKQSKKHAEMVKLAKEADISTRIGKGTTARLEVRMPIKLLFL